MSQHLLTEPDLDGALQALASTPRLLVCCDFDGTISTLVDEPSAARPVDGAVTVLDALATLPHTWAVIISGRALIDLTQLAEMPPGVHLVGSHGSEFEVGTIVAVGPGERELLTRLLEESRAIVQGVPGVSLEAKPASVAIHVRRASRPDAARVLTALRSELGRHPDVRVIEGKEVIEFAVFSGNKASALETLRSRWNVSGAFFAGDDTTDESAFAALAGGDVGVKVGGGASAALWSVSDPATLVTVLRRLQSLRSALSN